MGDVLWQVGALRIYTFGAFVALGFLAGVIVSALEARRRGLPVAVVIRFALPALLASILAARLVYVLVHWGDYAPQLLGVLNLPQGGFSFYGGLVGALFVALRTARRHGVSPRALLDSLAPGAALGQAVGFIGSDLPGETTLRMWAVVLDDQPVHPHQAYALALLYALFFFLWRRRRRQAYGGQLFITYLFLHAGITFVLEFFRMNQGDVGLTVGQWGAVGVGLLALGFRSLFARPDGGQIRPWQPQLWEGRSLRPRSSAWSALAGAAAWVAVLLLLLVWMYRVQGW